jgi:hypothetical protein
MILLHFKSQKCVHYTLCAHCIFLAGLECVSFFSYDGQLRFLGDVWIRTQSAAAACGRAYNLSTHPSSEIYPAYIFLAQHRVAEIKNCD